MKISERRTLSLIKKKNVDNPHNTYNHTQKAQFIPLAKSFSSFSDCVRRPSGFCCSDTQLPRAVSEASPTDCGRDAIGQLEYNCNQAKASHWPGHLPIYLDSASRVLNCSQCITLCSLYLGVNNHCKLVKINPSDPQY